MLARLTAVLSCKESNELGIGKRNCASVCCRAVQGHLECLGTTVNNLTVCGVVLVVIGIQIQTKGTGNDRIIKGMNGAFQVLDDFFCRSQSLFTCRLIIGCCSGTTDRSTRVYGKRYRYSSISIDLDGNIRGFFFILHIVGLFSGFISVLWDTVDGAGLHNSCDHRHCDRLIGIICNRCDNLIFFFYRRYREHVARNTGQF